MAPRRRGTACVGMSTVILTFRVRDDDTAAVAGTLLHEYAHALLHDSTDAARREAREREAEAVAYVVGRHFDLEMDGSARYLAACSRAARAP